jgi:hypothetical protein
MIGAVVDNRMQSNGVTRLQLEHTHTHTHTQVLSPDLNNHQIEEAIYFDFLRSLHGRLLISSALAKTIELTEQSKLILRK